MDRLAGIESTFQRQVRDAGDLYDHRMRFDGWEDRPLPKLYQCTGCGATAMLYDSDGRTVSEVDPRLHARCVQAP